MKISWRCNGHSWKKERRVHYTGSLMLKTNCQCASPAPGWMLGHRVVTAEAMQHQLVFGMRDATKLSLGYNTNTPLKHTLVWITASIHHPPLSRIRGLEPSGGELFGPGTWQVAVMVSLSCAMCVRFTREGGAKGNSDGQLVCNTLHGVVRQPGQRVQLLPGVGGRGNTFLRAAEQHDVTAYIQRALDSTRWHRWGHWQMERVGGVVLTTS